MPETSTYYHIAYTVALGIYSAYALSLYFRRKRLRAR
jgi:Mg2+ and Co2+ transporter CorA